MSQYNIIAESSEYTVVSEYEHTVGTSDAYQSEADLVSNLRRQLEKLNSYHFSDNEWEHFFGENLANKNARNYVYHNKHF